MERRVTNSNSSSPRTPAAVITPIPSVVPVAPISPFPISPARVHPTTSLLSEMLSVLGVVDEGAIQQVEDRDSMFAEIGNNCISVEDTSDASSNATSHRYSWTKVYCVLLHETLYFYEDQVTAESDEAVAERDAFRGSQEWSPPQVADIRLPLHSIATVRSVKQEHGENCLELSGEDVYILRALNRDEMNEWMFQFLRAIASVLRGLMDSARSTPAIPAIEFSPVRRHLITANASYSPRLSLTHGHGRNRRRSYELEENHDHIMPFPMDGSRLVSPLVPRFDSLEPELCISQTTAPETERPTPYIPPFQRRQYIPRSSRTASSTTASKSAEASAPNATRLGGCADPQFVAGSIMDDQFIPRKASKLRKVRSEPFGYRGEGVDIGAYSDCGPAKETNEDSFMVSTNLHHSFDGPAWDQKMSSKLFCVFDGHGGDHAARFAAEQLTKYIYQEYLLSDRSERIEETLESILSKALLNLDSAFCNFCQEGGRDWDSGSTALVATLIENRLIVANIGDARGILGRAVTAAEDVARHQSQGWNELSLTCFGHDRRHLWKEVAEIHSPGRPDEAERIAKAGGWITSEQEIPVSQLRRMDLDDDEVYKIVERCFADRFQNSSQRASAPHRVLEISRTCGDLSVSRALGDRHYKASYNTQEVNSEGVMVWDSSYLYLCYPKEHDGLIEGDLVSNQPEFISEEIGDADCEFLLLACDGLWDVLDADDAYRVAHDLLFEKEFSAKQAAARLSELAIHLGSSDNVTVIVVRFLPGDAS